MNYVCNDCMTVHPTTERCLVLIHLTEQSSLLLNTQDVALLFDCSYDHVYKRIISHPEFPKAIRQVDGKIRKYEERRWIAGDVIRYIRSLNRH